MFISVYACKFSTKSNNNHVNLPLHPVYKKCLNRSNWPFISIKNKQFSTFFTVKRRYLCFLSQYLYQIGPIKFLFNLYFAQGENWILVGWSRYFILAPWWPSFDVLSGCRRTQIWENHQPTNMQIELAYLLWNTYAFTAMCMSYAKICIRCCN